MIHTNSYDDQEYTAFVLNESRVRTDDRELDEFAPETIFGFDHAEVREDISGIL